MTTREWLRPCIGTVIGALVVLLSSQAAPIAQAPQDSPDLSRDARVAWLAGHAVGVRSGDPKDEDFRDLAPLRKSIGDSRIAMLGDPSHVGGGSFLAMSRIVKFLHHDLGFDVLVFESGLYDMSKVWESLREGGDVPAALGQGLFSIFGTNEETLTGTYTAPDDESAWFIQGSLEFADATDVDVSYFSIKRTQTSDATEDFQIALNGKPYVAAGRLARFKTKDFAISPVDLADQDGIIRLKASIKGNHYGMAHLIYRGPLLMGRNARYSVNGIEGNTFDITLTTKLSGFEEVFKMFPFSTKYGAVAVGANDAAGEHHVSTNKNQWITSDVATSLKRLRITYPA